ANFAFSSSPTTALLTTVNDKSLLGDLTGKTLAASVTVTASDGAVSNHAATPCDPGTPASVRLYFAGDTTGKFTRDTAGYSRYWWSNPVQGSNTDSSVLAAGTVKPTVPLDVSNWSDWGGEPAYTVASYFAAAVTQ